MTRQIIMKLKGRLGTISKTGKTVYIDTSVPKAHRPMVVHHERTEYRLLKHGVPHGLAEHKAQVSELKMARSRGYNISSYAQQHRQLYRQVQKRKGGSIPKDVMRVKA